MIAALEAAEFACIPQPLPDKMAAFGIAAAGWRHQAPVHDPPAAGRTHRRAQGGAATKFETHRRIALRRGRDTPIWAGSIRTCCSSACHAGGTHVAALTDGGQRQLAYEMAVCVCDADGRQTAPSSVSWRSESAAAARCADSGRLRGGSR
jgi:hypothetical protein